MTSEDRHLSDERAHEVWRRAARMQAEAARRLEERSPVPAAGEGAEPEDGRSFRLSEVRAAAVEAGIAPEFVELALAELETGGGDMAGLTGWQERAAARLLGVDRRTLGVSRAIDRAPARVYEALWSVLPAQPYSLALREAAGGDPLAGGILLFDVRPPSSRFRKDFAFHAHAVGVKQLRVSLAPLAGREGSACELTVSADLGRGVRRNWVVAKENAFVAGSLGGMLAAVAAAEWLAAAGAIVALPVVGAALAVGGLAAWDHGDRYRRRFRELTRQLEQLLQAVDVHARTQGAFAPSTAPRPGDRGAAAVASGIAEP